MALYWVVSGWMRMTFPCSSKTVCIRMDSVSFSSMRLLTVLLMMVVALRLMLFSAMVYKVGFSSLSIHRKVAHRITSVMKMADMVLFGGDMAR